jgi:hypothetical protein
MHELHSGLRDMKRILGSSLLAEAGQLPGTDLPAVFHDDVFVETGPRIVRSCGAIEYGGEAIDCPVLRFADQKLHVCRSRGGLFLSHRQLEAKASALRMALGLVAGRLGAAVGAGDSGPPAALPA